MLANVAIRLEVTGVAIRSLFGLLYLVVSAHSHHIQKRLRLDHAHERRAAPGAAECVEG